MSRDTDVPRKGTRELLSLTPMEWGEVVLAVISLILLNSAVAPDLAAGKPAREIGQVFIPHIVLIALIVGGLRRVAVVLQTFILLFGAVVALGLWLGAAMGGHAPPGYGLIALLQLPLFVLCYRSGKQPFAAGELAALGPRIALGGFVGVAAWFAAGLAMHAAAAPARARDAAILLGKRREAAKREAYARVDILTACLQQSPAGDDSLPFFPATLGELAGGGCREAALAAPEGFVVEYDAGRADSTGRHRTFHLAMHDSVMSDTASSYEADESMIVRSFSGQGKRRFSGFTPQPMEVLHRVGRCIEQARDSLATPGTESYPASVAEARRRRSCEVGITADSSAFREAGNRASFIVHYAPPARPRRPGTPGGFTLLLEPQRDSLGRGIGGSLVSLFSDSAGVIHLTRRPRAATASDPAIPDCLQLYGYGAHDPRLPCREYRPRQRWGLTSELPTIALSMSGTGTLGIGEELNLLPHYQALLPTDSAMEVRVRWDSGGADSVLTRRRGVPFGEPIGNARFFRFRHTWADTGMKRVRVAIRTAAGEEYEARHDIHVVPHRP